MLAAYARADNAGCLCKSRPDETLYIVGYFAPLLLTMLAAYARAGQTGAMVRSSRLCRASRSAQSFPPRVFVLLVIIVERIAPLSTQAWPAHDVELAARDPELFQREPD